MRKEKNNALLYLLQKESGRITGTGYCKFGLEEKTAEFFGRSADYFEAGILGIDVKHLDLVRQHFSDMNIKYNPLR